MAVADRHGLPIAFCTESATPHEVTLVQQTLAEIFVQEPVQRLIGDNAYDSDQLDQELSAIGVEMIAPHRKNGTKLTQDGRSLRRLRRRWKIERLFGWLLVFADATYHLIPFEASCFFTRVSIDALMPYGLHAEYGRRHIPNHNV